ncbi:hypothetical protein ACFL5Z_09620 [Planctomycetota bacterium]
MLSLQDALNGIRATQVDYFEANLKELQYAGGNCVKIGMDTYELASDAWRTLCRYSNVPHDLLPQLGRGLGQLVLRCLNANGRRAKGVPEEFRLSCDDKGQILTIAPSHLVRLTNPEITQIIEEIMPADIISETLYAKSHLTQTAFELNIYTEQLSVEPRKGDILYGGVSIRHSQAGIFPTVVLGYIHRLICTNGMTQRICLAGKPARTKRSKAQNSKEPVVNAIREQIQHAFVQLEDRLRGIKELTKHRLDISDLPESLRRRWSINKRVAAEIAVALNNDELGRTYTEYDLVNALSRVATHSRQLAQRYQRHLSLAAGMFAQHHIHQCPQCGTWLRNAN